MLLPHQLARMKLGCRVQPGGLPAPSVGAGAVPVVPGAYGRLISTPRVQGHNDIYGDCVETMAANAAQTALGRAGVGTPISNNYPEGLYRKLTGFRPGDPASDRGTNPAQLFDWWERNVIAGYRLAGVTRYEPQAEALIRQAIVETGGVALIVELSVEQQNQRVWMPAGTPGSWGVHAIWADSYDGGLTFATSWGEMTPIDRSYFEAPGFVVAAFRLDLVKA